MPSIACRDAAGPNPDKTAEDCDWYFRDPDDAKLLITAFKHHEEGHVEEWEGVMKAFQAGDIKLVVPATHPAKFLQYYAGEEPSKHEMKLACKDVGPSDCEEVVVAHGFIDLLKTYITHVEDKHSAFLKETLKKMPVSQFFENMNLMSQRE